MARSKKTGDQDNASPEDETQTASADDTLQAEAGTDDAPPKPASDDLVEPTSTPDDDGAADADPGENKEPWASSDESTETTEAAEQRDPSDPSADAETVADTSTVDATGADADAETETPDETEAEMTARDDEDVAASDVAPEPTPELAAPDTDPASLTPPPATPQAAEKRRGGFVPLVLGGVIAAGLGYGAALFGGGALPFLPPPAPNPETTAALERQDAALAELEAAINAQPAFDPAPLTDAVDALESRLAALEGQQSTLASDLAGIERRLADLADAGAEAGEAGVALAAYEAELAALRDAVAESQKEIASIASQAQAAQSNAAAQTALGDVLGALQEGRPYADALATLSDTGVSVPQALAASADTGVIGPLALIEGYPPAARAALAAARRDAEAAETGGGLLSFFEEQLGARSVTPRAGDDPDAVLSRAEAALRGADLAGAIEELSALPDTARDAMGEWLTQAQTRAEALAAADALAQDLSQTGE